MISGTPPNRRFHSESLRMTTGSAPGFSSSGVKSRPCAGVTPSVAKNPHEDRFDLVVEVVGSYNFCALLRRDLLEELPTATTPFFLARTDGRCAARDAGKSAAECLSRDKCRRSSRGFASAVIKGRDRDLLAGASGKP